MAENSTADGNCSTSQTKARVVVVGAGIAGVTAAAKLVRNDIKDVIVLEAQGYVGGRLAAQVVGNKMLDMGAMFIHGRDKNPLFEIAKSVGTVIEDGHDEDLVNRPEFFYSSKREKVPFREVESLIDFLEDELEEPDFLQEDLSRGYLIGGFYKKYLQCHGDAIDPSRQELYDAAFKWYCFYEKVNEGSDSLYNVSAWAGKEYVDYSGNRYTRVKGGLSTIMKAITDLIPEGLIRLKTPVANIDWSHADDGNILVHCRNGDVISTNHVILTMSSGYLKAMHSSMFQPSLPSPFLKTIQNIELGAIGKIFLKWDTAFWNEELLSYEFLWLESHPVTLNQDKSKRKTKLGKLWWEDIPGCETVSEHEDLLLIWLLQHQVEIVKDLDDEELLAVLHELLQHFFFDMHVPKPSSIYKTKWLENPYICGTYTYPTPCFQRSDQSHLTEPIPTMQNPRLAFAGEGYSLEHMTSAHGAFITGEQQAANVLHANGITDIHSIVDLIAREH